MTDVCIEADCGRPVHVKKRGLCRRHYEHWWKGHEGRPRCSIEGCDRPLRRHGMCELHDDRVSRSGSPSLSRPSVLDRFWSRVQRRGDDECWTWTGTTGSGGYGDLLCEGVKVLVHRFSFEVHVGPIPEGMDIDHTCHDPQGCAGGPSCPHRRCVNPRHLEPVSHQVNIQRGHSANRDKTHCKRGHEFTPENTYRAGGGGRGCKACRSLRRAGKI